MTAVQGREVVSGCDVSRWQGHIDWAQYPHAFAILKASGGDAGLYVDPMFSTNAHGCRVPWGAYHFASRMTFSAIPEAQFFASAIRGTGWTLPPVLDWEPSPSVNAHVALAWVLAFCAEVERQLGVRPMIYTGAYVSLERGPELRDYDLWLAAYTSQPIACAPWGANWSMWQHSSTGVVPGIVGNVDMNWVDAAWLARHAGAPTPAPTTDATETTPTPITPAPPGPTLKDIIMGKHIFTLPGHADGQVRVRGDGQVVGVLSDEGRRALFAIGECEPLPNGDEWIDVTDQATSDRLADELRAPVVL